MSLKTRHFYQFDAFRVDATNRLLLRDGEVVPLPPKSIDLLVTLVEQSGRVISKDELMQRVWPDSFVEEANLSNHVFTLRKALGENKNGKRYIETISRRGYRFIAEVVEISDAGEDLIVKEQTASHIIVEQAAAPGPDVQPADPEQGDDARLPPAVERLAAKPARPIKRRLLMAAGTIIVLGLAAYLWIANRAKNTPLANLKSIAVLPFKPLVAESHDEYLELGMADTLITKLSSLRQIAVRPTSAVRKYVDPQQDAVAVGHELQVESVLDAGLQRLGDRLRVTVRLINVRDGATLWADKFDEKFTDIFAVQDSISQRLAEALALRLSNEGKGQLTRRYTANVEAYQLYLRGRYYWSNFDQQNLETSSKFFHAALEKDQAYALAHAGLASVYSVMGIHGLLSPTEAFAKSREAALAALRLDDQLAEAHAALGAIMFFYDWDWSGAEQEFKRAIELDAANLDAHSLYGYCLLAMGRADEAVVEEQRAHEIDPVWAVANNDVALALYFARRHDEVIRYAQDSLKLKSNNRLLCIMGQAYLEKGMPEQAVSAFQQALNFQANYAWAQAGLGYAYAKMGKPSEAMEMISRLKANASKLNVVQHSIAAIYGALGEKAQAFAWLEKAYADRTPYAWYLKLDPRFDSLRADARFTDMLRRLNLEQ